MASKAPAKRAALMGSRTLSMVAVQGNVPEKAALNAATRGKPMASRSPAVWSFTGLLAAQRITKNLKERRTLKLGSERARVTIVAPEVPAFASKPKQKIQISPLQKLLEEYLPKRLGHVTYDPKLGSELAKEVAEELKQRVKSLVPPRYKVLTFVALAERGQEDLVVVSRCLWDAHADNYVSHNYKNDSLFCVACVFMAYCE
ncbi:tctex1 domain-containing protein 2-like [Rhinatrema bivittatum]|uniref:tctex1 domain-containing protein 2-like n=1 Tax=Rhinatrema bivittatum TaxID=194408 RepID=UPI00112A8D55|nr:tctex1 domain-containing protein 2-like [Rhinatrema bivittatum]